jgi:hypothetical protein
LQEADWNPSPHSLIFTPEKKIGRSPGQPPEVGVLFPVFTR